MLKIIFATNPDTTYNLPLPSALVTQVSKKEKKADMELNRIILFTYLLGRTPFPTQEEPGCLFITSWEWLDTAVRKEVVTSIGRENSKLRKAKERKEER